MMTSSLFAAPVKRASALMFFLSAETRACVEVNTMAGDNQIKFICKDKAAGDFGRGGFRLPPARIILSDNVCGSGFFATPWGGAYFNA
jgi:hypothetical protein